MDKNRIEGRHGAPRGHNTPKATGMSVEVNAAAVRRSNASLPGEVSPSKDGEKSAEAIVVEETSRGLRDARLNCDTGSLTRRRAEPMRRGSTPPRTSQPMTPAREAGLRAVAEGSMEPLKREP